MPRGRAVNRFATKKERSDYVLAKSAAYAYDDQGNLKPNYERWIETGLNEAAPILATGSVKRGGSKPEGSVIWTSTAEKMPDGSYTSAWAKWAQSNQPDWFSPVGYLYRVTPGALSLSIDTDRDAESIYDIFYQLGRGNNILYDTNERQTWDVAHAMRRDFPWDEIAKHFDCVHHYPHRSREEFLYGWDVESTVWFKTAHLQLIGEVNYRGSKEHAASCFIDTNLEFTGIPVPSPIEVSPQA